MSPRIHHKRRIGDLLVEEGLVTAEMIEEAAAIQKERGGKIVETLIALGYLTPDEFVNFLSRQPGIASLDLTQYRIPRDVLSLISRETATRHEIFPIDKMGKLLTLGMACPIDATTISQIEKDTGLRVKPILCSQEDIRYAIENYYENKDENPEQPTTDEAAAAAAVATGQARTGLKLQHISNLLRDLESLPALPETVERVRSATDDLGMAPKQVAEIIAKDPPVAAKVLSVANSAAYGFASQVGSIELAVALLGLRETYSIVLSAAVLNLFEVSKHFNYKDFWEEAMNGGAASRIIGKACGREKDSTLFSAGLLHDIGRIALLETAPDLYTKVPADLEGDELIAAEQKIVGIAHTEAGFELAERWGLPDTIAYPIRYHHHVGMATAYRQEAAVIALAEQWTRCLVEPDADKERALTESQSLIRTIEMDSAMAGVAFDLVASLERSRFSWNAPDSVAAV